MIMRRAFLAALLVFSGFTATGKSKPHSVTLTWVTPAPVRGMSVVGYNVYRRSKTEKKYTKIASGVPGPPYEDHNVVSGKAYFYTVTALDKTGRESSFSQNIEARIP